MKKLNRLTALSLGALSITQLAQANCVDLTGTYQPDPNNANCSAMLHLPLPYPNEEQPGAVTMKTSTVAANDPEVVLDPGFGLKQEGCNELVALYATEGDPDRALTVYNPAPLDMSHAQFSGQSVSFNQSGDLETPANYGSGVSETDSMRLQLTQLPSGDLSLEYRYNYTATDRLFLLPIPGGHSSVSYQCTLKKVSDKAPDYVR
jgi:hypothetical protein